MSVRIHAAPPAPLDPIGDALKAIFATSDGREFAAWCHGLASRDHYPDAAKRLQMTVTGVLPDQYSDYSGSQQANTGDSLIRVLYLRGDHLIFRVARVLGCAPSYYGGSRLEPYTIDNLLAMKSLKARRALASLGYVGSVPWAESSPLPTNKRERAGLALHLLVRAMFP